MVDGALSWHRLRNKDLDMAYVEIIWPRLDYHGLDWDTVNSKWLIWMTGHVEVTWDTYGGTNPMLGYLRMISRQWL